MQIVYLVLVFCINNVLSAITAIPGVQRKSPREGCNFQWSVTGDITNYSVYNQTLGFQSQLKKETSHTLDSQSGVVTLIIWDIQLSDAGNYSLSVTIGTATQVDTSALLFVYGQSQSVVNQTSAGINQQPATEGDAVELTCTVTSSSLPVAYQPRIYYQWYLSWVGYLQNISSGPAHASEFGASVPGYSIKDDGKTLVIASTEYFDTQYRASREIRCYGREQWSPYSSSSSSVYYLPLKYRPYITSREPAGKKFNAVKGDTVTLGIYFSAMPDLDSTTNWSFVDTAGQAQELPTGSSYSILYSMYYHLTFTFSSEAYYGYYSVGLSNAIGSTTETFQVLRPGPPDAPSRLTATFVSSSLIVISWNCMWFNGRPQQTFAQLKSLSGNSKIDILYPYVSNDCYNSSYTAQFQNGIQPESDYEVSVWSSNDFGSSDIVKVLVKTPKIFKLSFSNKTVSLNGNQATVKFNASEGTIAMLSLQCCLESTGICDYKTDYDVDGTVREVTCDNIPMGNVYVFDLYVYGGYLQKSHFSEFYYLGMVKGVRLSRLDVIEPEESDGEKTSPLLIAVIVLGVLLGVAVLALIGCLIAFLVCKRHQSMQLNNSQSVKPNIAKAQPSTQRTNGGFEDDGPNKSVEKDPSRNDEYYTAIEEQRYT